MKGLAVNSNRELSVVEVSIPQYSDCQALVKTISCGVCNGTDTKLIEGKFKNMTDYPMLLGHEAVGEVIEVGSKVTKYKVGDIVLLPFVYGEHDEYVSGWGGYCEYALVGDQDAFAAQGKGYGTKDFDQGCYAQTVVTLSDKVDHVGASMIVTFREVLSAIKRFGFKANESILIFGAGPVGTCFTKFAKLLGLGPIMVADISDEKADAALAMGADYAWNSTKTDIDKEIKKILPSGVDNLIDAVGINELINQGLRNVKDNGKVCAYGISSKLSMNLNWADAPYNWSVNFIQMPSKYEEYEAHSQIMAWIEAGVLNPYDFISDVIPFSKITTAFDLVAKKLPETKKIVIDYKE